MQGRGETRRLPKELGGSVILDVGEAATVHPRKDQQALVGDVADRQTHTARRHLAARGQGPRVRPHPSAEVIGVRLQRIRAPLAEPRADAGAEDEAIGVYAPDATRLAVGGGVRPELGAQDRQDLGRLFQARTLCAQRRAPLGARSELEAHRVSLPRDRKSTRLNSSHLVISYAVFCLKKKMKTIVQKKNVNGLLRFESMAFGKAVLAHRKRHAVR